MFLELDWSKAVPQQGGLEALLVLFYSIGNYYL